MDTGRSVDTMKSEKILAAAAMLPKISACLAEDGYEIRSFSLYRPAEYEGCMYGAGIQLLLEPKKLHEPKPKDPHPQGAV